MKRENELTLAEWDKTLASLGTAPYWFTISGGEPLMFPGIVELAKLAYKHCKPGIINIPTNGILHSGPERVRAMTDLWTDLERTFREQAGYAEKQG